jgi:hypothetical protein
VRRRDQISRHRRPTVSLLDTDPLPPGRHRAPAVVPAIPAQRVREDLAVPAPPGAGAPVEAVEASMGAPDIPETARWRASHLPRTLAGLLLAFAVLGTVVLAVRLEESRSSEDLVSLLLGGGVVVALWAVLIASTPQVVTLRGSLLTIHNRRGEECFDLAGGLQPVDVVGDPSRRTWAILLHRADRTSVVLRRHDVVATELDPIVRHYRGIAERRYAEREARFAL